MLGEAAMVDGLVRRVWAELGAETPVIATGGLAERMAPLCETIGSVDQDLTLKGLRMIYDLNRLAPGQSLARAIELAGHEPLHVFAPMVRPLEVQRGPLDELRAEKGASGFDVPRPSWRRGRTAWPRRAGARPSAS